MAVLGVSDIEEKAIGSRILREGAAKTLTRDFVTQVGGSLHALKVPLDYVLVAHFTGGDMRVREGASYAESVFHALLKQARSIGATPIATASVIDAQSTNDAFVQRVSDAYSALATEHRVAILNGELANYGAMVNGDCNIAGTMLSLVKRDAQYIRNLPGTFETEGTKFFAFDPSGKFVWMNSDGTGTKPLIACRFPTDKNYEGIVDDVFAMQADDWAKFGMARRGSGPVALCNLLSANGNVPFAKMLARAESIARKMGCTSLFEQEQVGDRLIGPHGEKNPFSISGTLVSVFDEQDLAQIPRPQAGDSLIAIKANGGRSNGFTDRRKYMVEMLGENWHETTDGKVFGEYLTRPSIVFYPIFVELISKGLASAVFHMSGGAFRDKLGGVLAKQGLYVEIGVGNGDEQLYRPDPCEIKFASRFKTTDAYTKFAMGNEGFVSTKNPSEALRILRTLGLEAKVVGTLEKRAEIGGLKFKAFNGEIVDHSTSLTV